jgi:hypothetical protein
MNNDCYVLAETPGLGRIYNCGSCRNVHFQVGAVSITLSPEAYLQVAEMVNRSAANFEVLMEQKARPAAGS